MGLEVYHPTHSPSQIRKLEEYCHTYGLVMTGGSDYHGPKKEKNPDFCDLNNLELSLNLLPPLKAAAKKSLNHPKVRPYVTPIPNNIDHSASRMWSTQKILLNKGYILAGQTSFV